MVSSAPESESLKAKTGLVVLPVLTRVWKSGGALYSEMDWKPIPIRPMRRQSASKISQNEYVRPTISGELAALESGRVFCRRTQSLLRRGEASDLDRVLFHLLEQR
jgi:hypothetical protein